MMDSILAKDVMNEKILTVRSDMTVEELCTFLLENEITGAPVVDEQEQLIGVVSLADVARNTGEKADQIVGLTNLDYYVSGWESRLDPSELSGLHLEEKHDTVWEIMTRTVYSVPENTTIPKIVEIMIEGSIHRIFVTRDDKLLGIITTVDLLRLLLPKDRPSQRENV